MRSARGWTSLPNPQIRPKVPDLGVRILDCVACTACGGPLDPRPDQIACVRCQQAYPRVGRIPVLLPEPDAHVDLWRRQLALLMANGQQTHAGLKTEAEGPGLLPDARTRLRAMAQAVRDQVDDFVAQLGPALGGPLAGGANGQIGRAHV